MEADFSYDISIEHKMIKKELYVICEFDGEDFAGVFMIVENEDAAKTICEKKNKRDGYFCYTFEKAVYIKKN